jgi:hypothetical protein
VVCVAAVIVVELAWVAAKVATAALALAIITQMAHLAAVADLAAEDLVLVNAIHLVIQSAKPVMAGVVIM